MRGKNRFDVYVVFPDIAFGIRNRKDVELTPEDVCRCLEEFCARIRNGGKLPPKPQPVNGLTTWRMSDEEKESNESEPIR